MKIFLLIKLHHQSNISNHWSFLDKEGEKFSMEIFHSFPQFFHNFSTRSEAECGNLVGYGTNPRSGNLFPWNFQKTEVGYRFIY